MPEDLLKCPFCGGVPIQDRLLRNGCLDGEPDAYAYYVRCRACAATGPWLKNPNGARRMWNMRDGKIQAGV